MTRDEIHENFLNFMERERASRGWSVDRMAAALEIPANTYRNMIYRKTSTIDIDLACRMFELTGKWMYQMTGYHSSTSPVVDYYGTLNETNKKIIFSIYQILYAEQEKQK